VATPSPKIPTDKLANKVQPEEKIEEKLVDHNEVRDFQRAHFARNFVLMTTVQIACLFNFHLLSYLANTFDQVYLTTLLAVSSEFMAYMFGGFIFEKLGVRKSLTTQFLLSGVGGIAMLAYGLDRPDSIAFPIIFLFCRFGVSGVQVQMISANSRIFDVEKSSTAFGLCNFFARLILSGAPLVSTLS